MPLLRRLLPAAAALFIAGCAAKAPPPEAPVTQTDVRVGTGADAQPGKMLSVNYTGWLYDTSQPDNKGRMFDTSVGKAPFAFVLGKGDVIKGWDQGVEGMKEGGLRRLVVPPGLAYGADGAGDVIPPHSTLMFDVELVRVVN